MFAVTEGASQRMVMVVGVVAVTSKSVGASETGKVTKQGYD